MGDAIVRSPDPNLVGKQECGDEGYDAGEDDDDGAHSFTLLASESRKLRPSQWDLPQTPDLG